MSPSAPWFRFWPDDWAGGTRRMPLLAKACYTELLLTQWHEGSISGDEAELASDLGLDLDEFRVLWKRYLSSKFVAHPDACGRLINERMDLERKYSASAVQVATDRARRAALARWNKDAPSNATSNAQALPEQCPSNARLMQNQNQNQNQNPPSEGVEGEPSSVPAWIPDWLPRDLWIKNYQAAWTSLRTEHGKSLAKVPEREVARALLAVGQRWVGTTKPTEGRQYQIRLALEDGEVGRWMAQTLGKLIHEARGRAKNLTPYLRAALEGLQSTIDQ